MSLLLTGCAQPPEEVAHAELVTEPAVQEEVQPPVQQTQPVVQEATPKEETTQTKRLQGTLEFEGYGPGKSHKGKFTQVNAKATLANQKIEKLEATIQADSVDTGIESLDKHLKNDDFFDVEKYPTITVESTSVTNNKITANLNFHGVEKEISFPATVTDTSVQADFLLDTTDFNFKYTAINKDVRILFTYQI